MEGIRLKKRDKIINQNHNRFVNSRGAKRSQEEAPQTGFGIIAGIIGVAIAYILFGLIYKLLGVILIGLFSALGFYGYRLMSKNRQK